MDSIESIAMIMAWRLQAESRLWRSNPGYPNRKHQFYRWDLRILTFPSSPPKCGMSSVLNDFDPSPFIIDPGKKAD